MQINALAFGGVILLASKFGRMEALPTIVVTRFIQWFRDFGIPVGGVLVNMVTDTKASTPDAAEFLRNRVVMQQHLQAIWREFRR